MNKSFPSDQNLTDGLEAFASCLKRCSKFKHTPGLLRIYIKVFVSTRTGFVSFSYNPDSDKGLINDKVYDDFKFSLQNLSL